MDRSAVFIDAGYLLAEGGKLAVGVGSRQRLNCDFAGLIDAIADICRAGADSPILRSYWYDASSGGIPTAEQLGIARLPYVKVRLGRLTGGHQKGVDSLILRDLMVLAAERSIATAYLVAGDEDLREAVVYAQDRGVRVVLIGVAPVGRSNQADTLVREADEVVVLGADVLAKYLHVASAVGQPAATASIAIEAREAAAAFGRRWAEGATGEEGRELLGLHPSIPALLDRELLFAVQSKVGSLEALPDLRKLIRNAFWENVRAGDLPSPAPEA